MTSDPRESASPKRGQAVFASGDASTSKDIMTIDPDATFSLNDLIITYESSGSTHAHVELYDDPEGTAAGSLNNQTEELIVSPGDFEVVTDIVHPDYENDLVAVVQENDDNVSISAGGFLVTG